MDTWSRNTSRMQDALKILCILATVLFAEAAPSWSTAIVSRIDDSTFHYDSHVWTDGIPFNEDSASTNNALFASYASVYVSKIRINMDGSGDGSCGNRCIYTFDVPDRQAGRYTLKDLVTLDGGVELKPSDKNAPDWVGYIYTLATVLMSVRLILTVIISNLAMSMTSNENNKFLFFT